MWIRTVAPVFFLTVIIASSARGEDTPRAQIQAAYDRMSAGFLRKDPKPLLDMLATDFTNAGPNGQVQTRAQFIHEFTGMFSTIKRMDSADAKIKTFSLKGGNAVVKVNSRLKMVAFDKTGMWGAKGKQARLEIDMMDRETWTRSGGKWLLKRSETLPGGKLIVNDKRMGGGK